MLSVVFWNTTAEPLSASLMMISGLLNSFVVFKKIIEGLALRPRRKSPQITKITQSLYIQTSTKHHSLLGYNTSPFESTDKPFLSD